jgi:hypothetical protein
MNNNDIINELDYIDNRIEFDNLNDNSSYFEQCSKHLIQFKGVAGGCPICLLRVLVEEKIRIEEQGY